MGRMPCARQGWWRVAEGWRLGAHGEEDARVEGDGEDEKEARGEPEGGGLLGERVDHELHLQRQKGGQAISSEGGRNC
jgi:hypothetical protein